MTRGEPEPEDRDQPVHGQQPDPELELQIAEESRGGVHLTQRLGGIRRQRRRPGRDAKPGPEPSPYSRVHRGRDAVGAHERPPPPVLAARSESRISRSKPVTSSPPGAAAAAAGASMPRAPRMFW